MSKPPVADHIQVNFRIPADLRKRIKAASEKNGVSMTAEIISALESLYPRPKTPADVVGEIAQQLAFIPPKLRQEAIDMLGKSVENGSLTQRVRVEQLVMRDQGWYDLPFDEDE